MKYIKRKNGLGFYRATEKGKAIKDFSIAELRANLQGIYHKKYLSQFKDRHGKSHLWYLNIKHKLL